MALLLAPCLALAGWAWWMQTRPKPTAEDFKPRIEKVEVTTPTPLQVWKGYDTQVILHLAYSRLNPPTPPGTASESREIRIPPVIVVDGRGQTLRPPQLDYMRSPDERESQHGITATYALKLASIPVERGKLTLKATCFQRMIYHASLPNGGVINSGQSPAITVSVSVPLRRTGEVVKVPSVSKARSFVVEDLRATKAEDTPYPEYKPDTEVSFAVLRLADNTYLTRHQVEVLGLRLETDRGTISGDTYTKGGKPINSYEHRAFSGKHHPVLAYYVSVARIPKSSGRVTFRAEISVDDCWPVPISIVVRNRDGSIPKSTMAVP